LFRLLSIVEQKETISIILGLLFPGAGHIYLGHKDRGIKIAISFVVITIIFVNVIPRALIPILEDESSKLVSYLYLYFIQNVGFAIDGNATEKLITFFINLMYGLVFIPPFLIWLNQIKDLLKMK
jgi:hypothetical protein